MLVRLCQWIQYGLGWSSKLSFWIICDKLCQQKTVGLCTGNSLSEALIFASTHNMTTDCSLNYKFNTWKFQAQTWGEHVVYRNCFWHSEQFLYTTYSPQRRAADKDLPVLKDGIVCQEMHICFFCSWNMYCNHFLDNNIVSFDHLLFTKKNKMSTAQHKFEYAKLWLFSWEIYA